MNTTSDTRVRRGWRSRWAAVGAAVAVSMGAGGGFLIADAANGSESSIVMADPVRILDTRDPVNVGLNGPFVSPIAQKLQVTGPISTSAGNQTVVPTGATGVLLNVTAVGATANGFISIRPGDATGAPATSSLNVTAGVTVPYAVQVALPMAGANAGKIDITWDALGVAGPTTDILIDVVGYTTDAKLAALQAEVDLLKAVDVTQQAEIDALAATVANGEPIMSSAREDNPVNPLGNYKVLLTVTLVAPVDGTIQLVGSTYVSESNGGGIAKCRLTYGAGNTSNSGAFADTDRGESVSSAQQSSCNTNGAIEVTAGTHVLNFVAKGANLSFLDTTLDAIFTPDGTLTEAPLNAGDSAEESKL